MQNTAIAPHSAPIYSQQGTPTDAMLAALSRRIELIRQSANEVRAQDFETRWLSVLRTCAEWFSNVPLSQESYSEAGGAFRWTVEVAFYAMRLAGGQKFGTNLPSEVRRRVEPQYNYAVFVAAACSGLDEPYRHFRIVRADGEVWEPGIHGAIRAWLNGKAYRLSARETPLPVVRIRTGMLASNIVPPALLGGMDGTVMAECLAAINPDPRPIGLESLIHKVVREAIVTAADFDRKARHEAFTPSTTPIPDSEAVAAIGDAAAASKKPAPVKPPAVPATASASATAPTPSLRAPEPTIPAGAPASSLTSLATTGAKPSSASSRPGISTGKPVRRETSPAAQMDLPIEGQGNNQPSSDSKLTREAVLAVIPDANLILSEFFQAFHEDVASGKATAVWSEQGLVLKKSHLGRYGVTTEVLIENLRKRDLMTHNNATEIALTKAAGSLIWGDA